MYDRTDYQTFVREHKSPKADPSRIYLAQQAEVSMDRLTHHPDWDKYLSMIAGRREELVEELDGFVEDLKYAQHVGDENLRHHRTMIFALASEIRALEWAMGLPSSLVGVE